jgi:hypothetical protein
MGFPTGLHTQNCCRAYIGSCRQLTDSQSQQRPRHAELITCHFDCLDAIFESISISWCSNIASAPETKVANAYLLQLASAETLIESAAGMVADAAGLMQDAGDPLTLQALDDLNNTILLEVEKIRKRRIAAENAIGCEGAGQC